LRWAGLWWAPLLWLTGCAGTGGDLGYYWQSMRGHLQVMQAARPVDDWLADAEASAPLKERLLLARRIRAFAVAELHLPDNASYHRYADLKRRSVVYNVVAAPAYSLTLKTWCFPVTGCVGYRGYYDEAAARAEAVQLKDQGLETAVYGVPAYSTLGWTNWLGGDPLLNTFIHLPEGELARMVFHELAHQVLYVKDDTMFNESFATAVERLGGARWLALQGSAKAQAEYADFDGRRRGFRALALTTRRALERVYDPANPAANDPAALEVLKQQAMQEFRASYALLKASWGGFAGYDGWVAAANNAAFGAQAAYDELVPGFEGLFVREGRNWPAFYDAAKKLAAMPKEARREALKSMASPG
jgi:predicted aminopeptidase